MASRKYLQRCIDNDRNPEVSGIIVTFLPWTADGPYLNGLEWNIPGPA